MEKSPVHIKPIPNMVAIILSVVIFIIASHSSASAVQPMVATGTDHSVSLISDGTLLAMGRNDFGQCDVSSWTNIVQVVGGFRHTVGLKSDGTVLAVGVNNAGQLNVGSWADIVQVAAGCHHTVGWEHYRFVNDIDRIFDKKVIKK